MPVTPFRHSGKKKKIVLTLLFNMLGFIELNEGNSSKHAVSVCSTYCFADLSEKL